MSYIYRNNTYHDISNLPAVPRLLVELLKLCHDDDADFESFARIIEQEPGLTTKILQVANSSAFRQWNDITDLRRMLIVLGLGNVKTIVATSAVEQFFSQFGDAINHQVQLVWIRSIVCANLCERLSRLLGHSGSGEAFLAGLLHQIGILVLLKNEKDRYLPLLETYHNNSADFCQKELELLQIDHCQMGAAVIESWQLDSFLADAIQFQQASVEELASAPTLLKILAVASDLNCGYHDSAHQPKAAQLLGLTAKTISSCLSDAIDKSSTMLTAIGIDDAFSTITRHHTTGTVASDTTSSLKLHDAIRHLTLNQAIAADATEDLIAFVKQARISFSSIFPLQQLFFLTLDCHQQRLTPINDLNLQQLGELFWPISDKNSQVAKAFTSNTGSPLTLDHATLADRQLLRLLGGDDAYLLPLVVRKTGVGLIALRFHRHKSNLTRHNLTLLKIFATTIAGRYSCLNAELNRAANISTVDFRKLAHEISNPLSIINNYLYILGKKLDAENPAKADLSLISEEIDRVGRILLHAQSSHQETFAAQPLTDVNKLITELDQILSNSLYKTGQIQSLLHLDKQLPAIVCSADKLKQVLINLTKNAAEALSAGGTINISTRDGVFQNQQQHIEITVQDDGPGIEISVLQQLFKPVSSTKKGHSGLGLAVVNSLINEMGGNITCCSAPDKGTEFTILIPRRTEE